jgi:hypothetical protein
MCGCGRDIGSIERVRASLGEDVSYIFNSAFRGEDKP